LYDYGILESYNGGKQYRSRIILECFIATYNTTSLPKIGNHNGVSMLDYAEESTCKELKNNNGNKWRNILTFTYNNQCWTPKQQKIFVNELCNHISHFDDIEEHLNDFIVQDTKDYLRKQHIIPSEEDLESLVDVVDVVDASHILQAFPTRTPTLDYYKSTAMSCDEQDNIQHSNQNINILIPRKKSTN
jgi:hypothetical protein